MNELIEKIERKEARLAVIGLGDVGLPLAVELRSRARLRRMRWAEEAAFAGEEQIEERTG